MEEEYKTKLVDKQGYIRFRQINQFSKKQLPKVQELGSREENHSQSVAMTNSTSQDQSLAKTEDSQEDSVKKRRNRTEVNTLSTEGNEKSLFSTDSVTISRKFGQTIWEVLEVNEGFKIIEQNLPNLGIFQLS